MSGLSCTQKDFNLLQNKFIQVPVIHHFHSKRDICIKTNVSGYIIDRVLS